jgi:hypothetical protein
MLGRELIAQLYPAYADLFGKKLCNPCRQVDSAL